MQGSWPPRLAAAALHLSLAAPHRHPAHPLNSTQERLDVSENSLTSLPDSLCGCSSLSVLIAFKNELKALPEDIGSLTHLQEANFFNNSLIRLPASISKCAAMLDFNVADNRLKTLPDLSQWTAVTRIAAFA